jgi:DNA-binding beta-propeller fold protein YncE
MSRRVAVTLILAFFGSFYLLHQTFATSARNVTDARTSTPLSPAVADTNYVRELSLPVNDVAFDKAGGKLYASVPSKAGAHGNSIARIDPVTGTIEGFVFVGSEPGKLALADDGKTLYVSLDGAAAIRRFDLTTQTPGAQFALGNDTFDGPYYVKDMAVAPGDPNVIAVACRSNNGTSPDFKGVAIYDNGVQRLLTTPTHTGSDYLAFSASSSILYGFSEGGVGAQKMSVTPSGVSVVSSNQISNVTAGDFKFTDGLIYMPFGQVYNPETSALAGTFTMTNPGGPRVEPDGSVGRVYFLNGAQAFDDTTIRTITLVLSTRTLFYR